MLSEGPRTLWEKKMMVSLTNILFQAHETVTIYQ